MRTWSYGTIKTVCTGNPGASSPDELEIRDANERLARFAYVFLRRSEQRKYLLPTARIPRQKALYCFRGMTENVIFRSVCRIEFYWEIEILRKGSLRYPNDLLPFLSWRYVRYSRFGIHKQSSAPVFGFRTNECPEDATEASTGAISAG